MVSIAIRFLAGRYHATGWDHHVNEGVPEWPPAPFRILRALVAASYRVDPAPTRDELSRLLTALACVPEYVLPTASRAHTRHWMPTNDKKTKVFDAFIAIGEGAGERGGEILISWHNVTLDREQRHLLSRLLDALGYLGRAESWVECRVLDSDPSECDARALRVDERSDHESRLLASESPEGYASWRRGFLDARPKSSKVSPPESWWDVLHLDTGRLHKEGWSSPPGTRWVRYGFERDPFRIDLNARRVLPQRAALPVVARYAIHSSVLPRVEETIAIGDRMRQALMAHSRNEFGLTHSVFLGRDADGSPLVGHTHAFFLPEDADGDGRIDSIVVWCREGFDARAQRSLRSVERLWGSEGHDLNLLLVALGRADEYGTTRAKLDPGASPALGPARVWRSATPFVPPRHAKRRRGRWIDLPEEQLPATLAFLGLIPVRVSLVNQLQLAGRDLAWHRFRRRRISGGGSRGTDQGLGFEIEFAAPVIGPIAVGYGAHFGLGRFEAVC